MLRQVQPYSTFPPVPQGGWPTNGTPFSPSQLTYLYWRAKGLQRTEIAGKMHITTKTLDVYVAQVCMILGVGGARELDKLLLIGGEIRAWYR